MIDIKLPISILGLNMRALHALGNAEIKTIEELMFHKDDLLRIPNVAASTNFHIREKLAEHGLMFKPDLSNAQEKNYTKDYITRLEGALDSVMALNKLQTERNTLRELTEDEIKEVADSVCHDWNKENIDSLYMTDFARAILKKAREK